MVIESHLVELESMGFTIVNDVRTVNRDALLQCSYRRVAVLLVYVGNTFGTAGAPQNKPRADRQACARDKVSSHHAGYISRLASQLGVS